MEVQVDIQAKFEENMKRLAKIAMELNMLQQHQGKLVHEAAVISGEQNILKELLEVKNEPKPDHSAGESAQ
jgi:hypothetical protein